MIIYNNNIITSGAYWNDEYAGSWCHEDCYATGSMVDVNNRRQVREGDWVVGSNIHLSDVPASGGTYNYNLGVTAPFRIKASQAWLNGAAKVMRDNGQSTQLSNYGSALTASNLLRYKNLEEEGTIVGAHNEILKYFPIFLRITIPRNTGRLRTGSIYFSNEEGYMSLYHPDTGNIYSSFYVSITQQSSSSTQSYGNLRFTINPTFSTSVGGYYIFTLYIGSNNYSIDTRTMLSPYTISNIPTGTYSLSASGRYYADGTYKELSFSFSPSSVTISKNGTASVTLTAREA